MTCRNRAFSLLEVLMVMALTVILLALLAQVLIPMGKGSRKGAQQIELQQVGQVALDRLVADLSLAPLEGVTLIKPATTGARTLLAVQQLADVTATGGQQWKTTLNVYWHDPATRQLCVRVWPPGPPNLGRLPDPADPFEPTPSELTSLAQGGRVLAGQVEAFEVDRTALPLKLRLALSAQDEKFELKRSLKLRNARF